MQQALLSVHDIYPHIRTVMGMVIGLGVTRLLSGVARIVQHPAQYRLYPVHLAWVASVLLSLVHFWWWEFGLYQVEVWTFGTYLFVIGYAILLFLQCALLFPDSLQDYLSYQDFFLARRSWFFGLLAATSLFDVIDTLIKGEEHFSRFAGEYLVRTPILVVLCIVAALTRSRVFHVAFVSSALMYQLSWIFRLFDKLT
ncbi:hypothetical protein CCO03_14015 [Comamonas serinivorans]|uniref:Uncharacterized protein n=1 Tax=Comamonas serinivorans TaxID=1082851 RepID=A0A1Y0EPV1_9BURK|nr:hypothetical protein [Comamonas serinivorans]ARU05653.1 hypothetical protein CCO03_14015 [Comamonas serinivorans]